MNMISTIRKRIKLQGSTSISTDEYNQLQSEWIRRAGVESLVQLLQAEIDEADRRAGAAERENATLKESIAHEQDWLRKAKIDAGFPENVSFDTVWEKALSLLTIP